MTSTLRHRVERVWGMVVKEFRQIMRDPRLSRLVFVTPILQLIVFGYAVSTDIWHTPTIVLDHDRTQTSRAMIEVLTTSGYFQITSYAERPSDIVTALDRGDALVGIEIPYGFTSDLQRGDQALVQILLDGSQSNTATVAGGYAGRIIQNYVLEVTGKNTASLSPITLKERIWYNPNLTSRNYNVPAVIGSLILLISLLLTSLAIVREGEIGTLEQLRVSPLKPIELIAGKTIPFGLIALVDLALVTIVAHFWFEIPFRGSLWLLFLASSLYILSCLGLGLLISTISTTQQEAFLTSFLIFMPALLLSGFMFPVSSMPEPFQWMTYINPVRHYIEVVRNLYLKGSNMSILWPQFLALASIGAGLLGFATFYFQRVKG